MELLEKRYHDGLIATTGRLGGHVLQSLLNGDEKGALDKAGRLQEIFGKDHLFVELQDHGSGRPAYETNPSRSRSGGIGAPLIATNDSHYTHQHDHEAHDAACVQTSTTADPKRFKFEHYLKTVSRCGTCSGRGCLGGVRQHAVGRRAGRRHDRVRKPQLPNFPIPAGSLTMPPTRPGGSEDAVGRRAVQRCRRTHRA
ncbi:MAG: PHP domain-containing protein [Ilumatobacteraceae bacterium]